MPQILRGAQGPTILPGARRVHVERSGGQARARGSRRGAHVACAPRSDQLPQGAQGGAQKRARAVRDRSALKIAIALGWAVELLQAFFLVADDIMDDSHTRRTKPCWFRTNNLGVKAFNDSILLESVLYQLVSSYCRQQPYYLDILELLHDVTLQTSLGQAMDLLSAPNANEKPNIDEFTMRKYNAIVKYKTAYYSFFLPVALAMHMAGYKEKATLKKAENILLPMGQFFQVQDDFLDCFGDPEVTGKVGTDIEDGKCSWLVVTALSICTPAQRQLIQDHYGLKEESSVQLIKTLYKELNIPQLYADYEESSYKELTKLVKNIEHDLPSVVFQGFMDKIYKRKL